MSGIQLQLFNTNNNLQSPAHQLAKFFDYQYGSGWPDTFGSRLFNWATTRINKPIKTLSLFSGGGGLDIGFHDAGFSILNMIEIDQRYVNTLQINCGNNKYLNQTNATCIDIREYTPTKGLDVDFIIGGPPCQTFSAAGRRAAGVQGTDDDRGMLFWEYVRILEQLSPVGFLFENVYGIIGAQNGKVWRQIKQAFAMVRLLLNRSSTFDALANTALETVNKVIALHPTPELVLEFISDFIDSVDYSARLLEIAMHSLFQALDDQLLLEGDLKSLSQMRSANKKHGNVADIEITIPGSQLEIIEAWDAKYGKPYLRDELEELNEKLRDHIETQVAGFVVDKAPHLSDDIVLRIAESEEIHDIEIYVLSFDAWANQMLAQARDNINELALQWLLAFTESLCQRKRDIAPIDEPSDIWVSNLEIQATKFFDLN